MSDTPGPALAGFVRAHDPDRFLCALFAPAERRPALFALLAYNHELARAREAASNPVAALIRLQWWRDAVAEAAKGKPPRRHEVATPLHAAIRDGSLDPAELTALADAREAEAEEGLPSRASLDALLRATSGGVAVASGRLLGASGPVLVALQSVGAAYGLAGVLRSVAAHAAQGRCLLPEEALSEAGLSAEQVVRDATLATPVTRALAAEALARFPAYRLAAQAVPREAIAAALPGVFAARDLRRLAAGREVPAPRGFGDRAALTWAGFRRAI